MRGSEGARLSESEGECVRVTERGFVGVKVSEIECVGVRMWE